MEGSKWLKQVSEPLFPDLLWSRPENKRQAGKLLIVGGNVHGFAAPVSAYNTAVKAGVGTTSVVLPGSLKKTITQQFPHFRGTSSETGVEFVSSTPSGSLAKRALEMLLDNAKWADGVLL